MASSSSAAAAAAVNGFIHDVFLSFRGTDTRYGFTGNLCKALCDKGFRTFIDDEELHKGEDITPSLLNAIQDSRIAIVVLSRNYASSSFCLDELSKIVDCIEEKGQLVWPVFYDVDPSDVRKIEGAYGDAMAMHEERFKDNTDKLQKWRVCLQQVANLSGWHFKHGDEYEHDFIGKIVDEVSRKIKSVALHVADYPVGLESQVLDVTSLLDVGFGDRVLMVGIHGIGGIGKTTLALAVYNSIAHHFEGSCYLESVRENSDRHGLLHLQKTLLSELVNEDKLTSVSQGRFIIQQRLQQKKVLLILDDVDKREQLEAIVGRPEWFGPGSRVIITTRDKHLLTCHGVENKYEVSGLNNKDALELLKWKAFKTDEVSPNYVNILNRAVIYACGLPLALEVIGSHLFKKTIEEWKYALDRYERIPMKEIQKILQVSYDALDRDEKSVFLDIACCFKGYNLAEVEEILHAHYGDDKKHHIGVLVDRSLIKISEPSSNNYYVILHDLIEDMGKEIVRLESPEELGKRSRLWFHKDIIQVLEENTKGTSKVEILSLNIPRHEEEVVEWKREAFKMMENLRTLIVRKNRQSIFGVLKSDRCSSPGLLFDFCWKKLFISKLDSSCFTSFMSASLVRKKFKNMRVLIIGDSQLLKILDISGLPSLEFLSFQLCRGLTTIPKSVGMLGKLRILKVYNCIMLLNFPPLELPSLEQLYLSGCPSLENFPTMVGSLDKLKILSIEDCNKLKNLPHLKFASLEELKLSSCDRLESFQHEIFKSVTMLGKLRILCIQGCEKLKHFPPLELPSIEKLYLSACASLESFPTVVGSLDKLKILSIERCQKLKSFPPLKLASLEELKLSSCDGLESFSHEILLLDKLKIFHVSHCSRLKGFPPFKLASLEELNLSSCESLESFPPVVGSLGKLKIFNAEGCRKLKDFPPLELSFLEELNLSCCESLERFPTVFGSLGKLKILSVKGCRKLQSFPPLELASLEQLDLSYCESVESFPPEVGLSNKLKILCASHCRMLRSFPPLQLASLEQLDLSYCESLGGFPEILGKMENITQLRLDKTPIKKLLFSFQNLTWLQTLYLSNCGIVELPSSIILMPKLTKLTIEEGGWLFPRQENGEEKESPTQTSNVEFLNLLNCNLSDESLAIGLRWFCNMKELDLSGSKFTTVPECIKECHFLWKLVLNGCERLQEIREIPPSLKTFSALNCTSLSSSCRRKLLNQELHEAGNTYFLLSQPWIPKWFDYQRNKRSFSFWFRDKFPAICLYYVSWNNSKSAVSVIINNTAFFYRDGEIEEGKWQLETYHLHLFHMQIEKFNDNLDKALLENEWNHAEVRIGDKVPILIWGIHVLKEKTCMEDIRFTDESFHLVGSPIEEFPFSFQNLSRLRKLYLGKCGNVQLPSSICMLRKLTKLTIEYGGLLFPKQDGDEEGSTMQPSNVKYLCLKRCILSDEFLAIGLKWFANVKELNLLGSEFLILSECIKECRFLRKLILDDCKGLAEIVEIPPSLKTLSALNCESLTSSSKIMLLNQELHEAGNTRFRLPRVWIPNWFDHQCMQGQSISFWFQNKFPAVVIGVVSPLSWNNSKSPVRVIINGNPFFYRDGGSENKRQPETYHLHLFHMQMEKFNCNPDKALLENKWNHVEVDVEFPFQKCGIHVLKERSSMEDIRFTDPENDINTELTL